MWTTGSRAWERELVAECEAFVSGHYAQYLGREGRSVAPWAWVNVLAHGGPDEIDALIRGEPGWRAGSDTTVWHEALAFLAQELVGQSIRQNLSLAELQRLTLVPLALELARRPIPSLDPTAFVARVRSAIARHPSSRYG
jgi:hypothetical protein